MKRLWIAAGAFALAALASGCSNRCAEGEADCFLKGLVLEQDGQALELDEVSREQLEALYPRTRVTELWAVGDEGTALHFTDGAWSRSSVGAGGRLKAVWGASPSSVWAVGEGGTVSRWDGSAWSPEDSGVTAGLNAIHGSDAENVWAVGAGGTALRRGAGGWSLVPTNVVEPLTGVFAAAAGDVWAVGGAGKVLRWNGSAWSPFDSPFPLNLPISAVWGTSASNVWAVGQSGVTIHFDGAAWTIGGTPEARWLQAVHGTSPQDVWALQEGGEALVHWNGVSWTKNSTGWESGARAVWAGSPVDAFIAGVGLGHWNGVQWSRVDAPPGPKLNALFGFSAPSVSGAGAVVPQASSASAESFLLIGSEDRQELAWEFTDPAGCTPSFCFSVCGVKSNCSTSVSCTRAKRDGRTAGTWRSSLGFSVEPSEEWTTFELEVVVLSEPSCSETPYELPAGEVLAGAGPRLAVRLEQKPEETNSGGGAGCEAYSLSCGPSSTGIETVGGYFPPTCACPSNTVERGGSHRNELCGLPGSGYDCRYCECR